ncbi:reverse transcriptase domain-containing protein [Tanacetum coccineum]
MTVKQRMTESKISMKAPELKLKDLPSHLEYAFLEENDKLPVIIAKGLKNDEKDALLKCSNLTRALLGENHRQEGIVLGHKISKSGIEVDRAKVDVIAKLPHPTIVKGFPDWNLPFELMCDASDFAIGAVLGQRKMKHFQPIHYASKTMTEAQIHYTTTEKEMLAVVYAFEKFSRPNLVLSKA